VVPPILRDRARLSNRSPRIRTGNHALSRPNPSPGPLGHGNQTRRGRDLAAVLDVYSRRIIGHSIDLSQTTKLVVDAMTMAVVRRDPRNDETVLHSDHGCQYTAMAYGKRLRESDLLGSMGTVGDCYDNAMMESFWGSMQIELLDTCKWRTRGELASAMFEWIECWYKPYRRHSSLGMLSPIAFEELYRTKDATA
jgi:putative transposase